MSGKKLLAKKRKTRERRQHKPRRPAVRELAPTDPLLMAHIVPRRETHPTPAPKPAIESVPEAVEKTLPEHTGKAVEHPEDNYRFRPVTPISDDDDDDEDMHVIIPPSPEPEVEEVNEKEEKKEEEEEKEEEEVPKRVVEAPGTCGAMFSAKGRRYYQEDRGVVDDAAGFYAVFDGHGGDKASRFCAKHMAEYVERETARVERGAAPGSASDADVERAFVAAFIAIDQKFKEKMVDDGSTACVARVVRTCTGADAKQSDKAEQDTEAEQGADEAKQGAKQGLRLHVANAGDSRCVVVCADGTAVAMSVYQKPHDPVERARIEAANHEVEVIDELAEGKRIRLSRVDGILAVARAIGDHSLKDYGMPPEKTAVTCVPVVQHLAVDPAVHRFVVIASDGVWDVFSNDDAARLVRNTLPDDRAYTAAELEHAAQALVQGAIDRNSADNCTAVVVAL